MPNILAFFKEKIGATAIEYSLLAAGIALILIIVAFLMGDELGLLFADLIAGMQQT